MKKNLIKATALLSTLALTGAAFAGCLQQSNPSTVITTSEAPSTTVVEIPESPDTVKPVTEAEYMPFIEGQIEAIVKKDNVYGLKQDASYNINTMREAIEEQYLDTYGDINPKSIESVDYGFIDCGNDGALELAVRVTGNNAEGMDSVQDYYIVKLMGGVFYIVDWYESYYRAWGELNKYGIFHMSGSGGASLMVESYERANADGVHEFIYSAEHELAMGDPVIYGYELPSDAELPEDYPRYAEGFGDNERIKYSFAPYDYTFKEGTPEYDAYLRQMVYLFHDSEGNAIFPSDEWVNMYMDLGVVVTDDNNRDQLILERLHELGISEQELKSPENDQNNAIDWKMQWDGLEAQP
jgi:hypothetical protein